MELLKVFSPAEAKATEEDNAYLDWNFPFFIAVAPKLCKI
jgi:hypothetical protein